MKIRDEIPSDQNLILDKIKKINKSHSRSSQELIGKKNPAAISIREPSLYVALNPLTGNSLY